MSMTLTVSCSTCGIADKPDLELLIRGPKDLEPKAIKERIEWYGWIVRVKDNRLYTYCRKKCAE
jgi:hypothetical protein